MLNYKERSDSKSRENAIGNKNKPNGWLKKVSVILISCTLALLMLMPMLHAIGLEFGPEIIDEAVARNTIEAPTITKAFIGTNTISGGNLHRGKINGKNARGTVHVTLKDSSGNEKATVSVTPKSGTTWTVNLPEGVTIAEGDTVTAYQEFDGQNSPVTTANAMDSLAKQNKDKLKMPTGEIYIEQTSSNQVNDDEQAEAVELFNNVNTAIAGDIKSVKFSIVGTDHAYYEVTYDDGSTSGQVEATNLQIKQVTEHSRGATLGSITIADNVIKGQLSGEGPFDGIKVQILLKLSDAVKDSYCDGGKCLVDKDTSDPVDATVNGETGEFSYTIPNPNLKLDQKVGVTVKEPHKFKSCSQTTVKPVVVGKTEVKDPRKLTEDDKTAIVNAIKEAYKAPDGTSKLPNGTGFNEGAPAVIQIDDSGNVKIFSGNDVVVNEWDNNGKAIPEKNEDGSVKLKDGVEPKITIPAKDLLKNIKPDAPTVALSEDKKSITITPDKKDTDAKIIEVTYTDSEGNEKTETATKADGENGKWSVPEGSNITVDADTGLITLEISKIKEATKLTAKVTDNGGLEGDTDKLVSDESEIQITKAIKVEALGGLDPVDIKKWVGDEVDWKKGVKAKDSATDENKAKIKEFLDKAKTTFADENSRGTTAEGDFTGKIKVTFDDGSFIEVDKQNLYVSNHVTSMDRKDKVPTDALDVEFKLGEGTKVDNTGSGAIEGNKDNPTSYSNYKVKPNTNLKDYKLPNLNASVIDSIKVTPQEGYTEPIWTSQNGTDFVASDTNKVFTATATKTYDITFDANSGSGTKEKVTQKVNTEYELPAANTFAAPENKQFSGWQVGEDTTLKQPGAKITITGDTVVKAIWKPIELKVNFLPGTGASGDMKDVPVNKGSDYKLPEPTFTPPTNQEFAGWKVGNEDGVKKAGETIKITDNVTLTATWKDIMVNVSYDANGGSGEMKGKELKKGSTLTLPANGFTAPENKEFKAWEVDGKEVAPKTEITLDKDTEVKAIWKSIMVDVIFDKGEGSGNKDKVSVAKGSEYTLPSSEGFTAPENKEFAGWEVNGETKKVGDKITVTDNTTVTAKYKPIMVDVIFDKGEGSGEKDKATVAKGSEYTLPDSEGFTPPANQEFAGWEVNGEAKKVGDKIRVNEKTTVTAKYKPIMVDVIFDKGEGSGEKDKATVAKGNEYTLPNSEGFTPPANQEFAGWEVNGETKNVGDKITVNENTTVTAKWKKIQINVPSTPEKPNPDQTSVIDREAGKDRIETSILISKQQYKKARTVIIVRNDLYPDALTAGLLGKVKPAPILLTPSKMLDPRVEAEIRRLGATEIIIVGGKSAISLDVEKALAAYDSDTVERLDGIDRYETATLVARKVAGLVDIRQTAIITTGENWPDALSASAFACKNNHPILLVRKNKIDQVVNRTMKDLKIGQVYLVGGPMAVSETVAKKLPKVITRIAGQNRYGTAKAVAEYGFKDAKGLYLASGEVYADALIIGPVAGQRNVPILLTQHKHLNAETKAYIEAHKPGWTTLVGGTLRIGPEVEKELKK